MNYEIVELEELSGHMTKIYSIIPDGEEYTLFDNFILENKDTFKNEVQDILKRLVQIGSTTGARESFFKPNEGKPGDMVCALYDLPDKHLRLYCIRFGNIALIMGGGGEKNVRAWQDDEKLSSEANKIIRYAIDIHQRIEAGDIYWSKDGSGLEGNLNNCDYE